MKAKKTIRKRYIILFIILFLLLSVTVGYSTVTTNLIIKGITNIRGNDWDIHFSSVKVTAGEELASLPPRIDNTGTIIDFAVDLANQDDYYEFVVEVYNAGIIDAKVSDCIKLGLSAEQEDYISYDVSYVDGTPITPGDVLEAGDKVKIKVSIKYYQLILADVSTDDSLFGEVKLSLKVNYVQR